MAVYENRAADAGLNLGKFCLAGVQRSTYDPYSIMHYPKYAFAKTDAARDACFYDDIDDFCTILPKPGKGISRDLMGESNTLTSRDVSGVFVYYRDQSPCINDPNGCTWRGFNVGGTAGGAHDFTLSASDTRYMTIQGGQIPIAAGLNRRRADGTYENLQFRSVPRDGYQEFTATLAPGTYRWYVHAENANTGGSVDMFIKN